MIRYKVKQLSKKNVKKNLFIAVVLAWPILQFLVFWLYTNLQSIILAFEKMDSEMNYMFCGINNFKLVFSNFFSKTDKTLRVAFLNSFTRYFLVNIVTYTFPIIFGFIIYKKMLFSSIYRYLILLPSIISAMLTCLLFEKFIHALPTLFASKSITFPDMLNDPKYSYLIMLIYGWWTGCTSCAIMYPNLFNSVNIELHEAAQIDGCTLLEELFKIYIPCIWPTITTFVVTGVSAILSSAGSLYAFWGSSAPYETSTMGYSIFVTTRYGGPSQYGYTAALNLCCTFMIYPLTLFVKYLMEKADKING